MRIRNRKVYLARSRPTTGKRQRLWAQAILLPAMLLSGITVCHASRGGPSGQDIMLAPNGIDTKQGTADAVKQEQNQKGGGQGGGGLAAGGGGYPWRETAYSTSFGGATPSIASTNFSGGNVLNVAAAASFPGWGFSGSNESDPEGDASIYNSSGYNSPGSSVYGSYGGKNFPDYPGKVGNVAAPLPVPRAALPAERPAPAKAALPPCCTYKLPCCDNAWPCCLKAKSQGHPRQAAPALRPLPSNESAGNVLTGQNGDQNQQGQSNGNYVNNNNYSNNGNSNSSNVAMATAITPGHTEGPPSLGNTITGSTAQIAATNQMMSATGMNGIAGGKFLSGSTAAVTGLINIFDQIRAQQMPGANKEQEKANQAFEKSVVADNLAFMEREQAAAAIQYVLSYLQNFTAGGNHYVTLHDSVFVPLALLLMLPGAVLAQMKATISQGFSVLGEVNPWEGILRSIVAIFFIASSGLIMNYSIDVGNSLIQTVASGYHRQFGSNMGSDAMSLHVRAHPLRLPQENYTVIPDIQTIMFNYFGNTPAAILEGQLLSVKYVDPSAGLYITPPDRAPETVPYKVPFMRVAFNEINCGLAFAWVVLCAAQVCYLYYLYLLGPVLAALWVYPSQLLRQAFPEWVSGVICLCFWSLFWTTTICLMACFRGVDDTGTVACTALLLLALLSAKAAFDFVGMVKDAARDVERASERLGRTLLEAREARKQSQGSG